MIRQDNGGVREAASKKVKTLHGTQPWLTPDHTVALHHWPKLDNFFAYKDGLTKGELPPLSRTQPWLTKGELPPLSRTQPWLTKGELPPSSRTQVG